MMSRRNRYIAAVIIAILISPFSSFLASGIIAMAQEASEAPDGTDTAETRLRNADILLAYGSKPSDLEMKSIGEIVKSLTYLQHSVVYLPVSQCEDIVKDYAYVICYNIGNEGKSLMDKLASQKTKVLMLGGEAVSEYIKAADMNIAAHEVDELAASLDYYFSDQEAASTLTRLENTYLLEGDFDSQYGDLSYGNKKSGLYCQKGSLLYTPCYDLTDGIFAASFANEAAIWLWPYKGQPHTYSQYLVLDAVYPFFPPEQLLEIIDYIVGLRLPFVISVMPVYQNGDYPSMKRFCEVLRYAQANGGAIILHAPNTVRQEDNKQQLWDYYTYATEAYTNYGVYPLGIEVPERFLFNKTDREIIGRYTTVFCYRDGQADDFSLDGQYNTIYSDGHLLIAPSYTMNQKKNCQILTLSTAAYINISEGLEAVQEAVQNCLITEVPLKNLWDINQKVYGNDLFIETRNGEAYYNGEKVSLEYTPFTYEKYKYKSGVFQWIAKDLTGLNHQLAFIVIISSVIFIAFIILGRQYNRKRFLIPRKKRK